ncbi:MAG: FAD-dependent oxidoreductase [bacterium]|nr:FAD-dependent oxidoreductase [bacterium]
MIKTYKTTLSSKEQLNFDIYLFTFTLKDPSILEFVAGQYLILFVPDPSGTHLRRLYSIASSPLKKDNFELLVQIVPQGKGSEYLQSLKVGDEAMFQGPAGMFTMRKNEKDIIFLATGTGIAPIKSILESSPNMKSHLFWGLKTYKDIYYLEEFKKIAEENKNFDFHICLSRETDFSGIPEEVRKFFTLGRITQSFEEKYLNSENDFYLCGGKEVVESLKEYLLGKGTVKENIFFEKFT